MATRRQVSKTRIPGRFAVANQLRNTGIDFPIARGKLRPAPDDANLKTVHRMDGRSPDGLPDRRP
jgi:hypothetical protein